MHRADLMERMAALMKRQIGPAVADEYPRSQAYLGAVVLQKLSAEMRLAAEHERAAAADRKSLVDDLHPEMEEAPDALSDAFEALQRGGDEALCDFIAVLYASHDALGAPKFDRLLARVRTDLRRGIDRRLEIAAS